MELQLLRWQDLWRTGRFTTHALYYNKDLFKQAGVEAPTNDWTWTDLQKAAKKISSKTDAKGFSFQMKPDPYDFEMYLWSNDTAYSDENGTLEGNIDSAKAIDTYQMFQDMEKDGSAVATEATAPMSSAPARPPCTSTVPGPSAP